MTESTTEAVAKKSKAGGPIWGTGRRKKSVARVRLLPGSGQLKINDREVNEYFPFAAHQNEVLAPMTTIEVGKNWDVFINVKGGGMTGQARAICLGLARALSEAIPEAEQDLRDQGLLTRDARGKERKKYGQRGARRRFQFSKR